MQDIRCLLVVIDPKHNESLALKRAKQIASVTKAHLHLLVCDRKNDHSALLSLLEQSLKGEAYTVSAQQAWHETEHQTIIRVQQAHDCGLVIKQHFPDNPLKKALLTPEDWKLLRYCPCPVLVAKTTKPWTDGVVLAAVDVDNRDPEHRVLHESIIDLGFRIASLARASLHVVSAHPPPMLAASEAVYVLNTDVETDYRKLCADFQKQFDIEDSRLHIEEGPADVIITRVARELDAVVTVMGTVARTGITGALIGNTAEIVLDELESDILVLKPVERYVHLENQLAHPA